MRRLRETLDAAAGKFRKERKENLELETLRKRFEENKKMLVPQFVRELLNGEDIRITGNAGNAVRYWDFQFREFLVCSRTGSPEYIQQVQYCLHR